MSPLNHHGLNARKGDKTNDRQFMAKAHSALVSDNRDGRRRADVCLLVTVPPVPDCRRIPSLSNAIQDLLRDPPTEMNLDMELGGREQSLPVPDASRYASISAKLDEASRASHTKP